MTKNISTADAVSIHEMQDGDLAVLVNTLFWGRPVARRNGSFYIVGPDTDTCIDKFTDLNRHVVRFIGRESPS